MSNKKKRSDADPSQENGKKERKKFALLKKIIIALAAWAAFGFLITLIFGRGEREAFTVEIFAPTVSLPFGLKCSECSLWGLLISAVIAVLALLFRFICVPRFTTVPKGIQNVMELAVSTLDKYSLSTAHTWLGEALSAYLMTVALFLIGCASLELFSVRSPSADILMTLSLSLITFFLINYYGLKQKGLSGRLKDFTNPTPIIAPIKMITDIAIPVSMACRLFGNMLAGLIIMELIYYALGNFAAGPPALAGLYFNLFHPLIQAFIFITLTLSFIGEAAEISENE